MNVLSLSAAFGSVVWIFQDGQPVGALGSTPTGSIEATQPILMLAMAFGLSMDYEVFLLSRVREEWDRTGDNPAAVATGPARTGPPDPCTRPVADTTGSPRPTRLEAIRGAQARPVTGRKTW